MNGAAALASIVGGVCLWMHSPDDLARQAVLLVFAASMVGLFTVSGLYHSFPWRRVWMDRMQRIDHSMIYVLIAGSYTPMAAVVLEGKLRYTALGLAWGIALLGILQKAFLPQVRHWLSVTMQVTQGWLGLIVIVPLARKLPWEATALTVAGGIVYTVGMIFYVTHRPRLWPRAFSYHEAFHVCVIAGSAAHYAMIYSYVAPFAVS